MVFYLSELVLLNCACLIVKSKNTYTLSFGFAAFVVAQFIAPLTFLVVAQFIAPRTFTNCACLKRVRSRAIHSASYILGSCRNSLRLGHSPMVFYLSELVSLNCSCLKRVRSRAIHSADYQKCKRRYELRDYERV